MQMKVKGQILILFCISGTVGAIEPKFGMHMDCDQIIISHIRSSSYEAILIMQMKVRRSRCPKSMTN